MSGPTYRIGEAAAVLGVSVDTARRWADGGELPTARTDVGHRVVAGEDLAAFCVELAGTSEREANSRSARNQFAGIVTKVISDSVMAQVEIQSGPHRVVALISAEAVESLGLAPGSRAVASVKATNVMVEVTGR